MCICNKNGPVVSVDTLACFDLLLWLGTGDQVSERLNFDQSTVCRNFKKCCEVFSLEHSRQVGEYIVSGNFELLNLERKVHQRSRWNNGGQLRIEGMFWSGRTYLSQPIENFIAGNHDFMAVSQPLSLLRNGVIDAWIAPFPDCPDEGDPNLFSIDLTRSPCHLVAAESHPLFSYKRHLSIDDVVEYPSLSLPHGAFPIFEAYAKKIGLWNSPSRILRYKKEKWEGRTENELTTSFSSVFALDMFAEKQRILPIKLQQKFGDVLVVKREYADHPRLLELKCNLLDRLKPWAKLYPEIRVFK